jgi:hypothetical protein
MSTIHIAGRRGRPHQHAAQRCRARVTSALTVLGTGAALVASASLLASAPASAATAARQELSAVAVPGRPIGDVASPMSTVGPSVDIVGRGLVDCAVATGEVGYSPNILSAGSPKTTEWYSIWFDATKCFAAPVKPGARPFAKPVPVTVIGALAFKARQGNICPQLGSLGKGLLYLTYNYPGVPNPMIDPSVADVTVSQYGPYWHLHGTVFAGSYMVPGSKLDIGLKPDVIGAQSCPNGITSEYIARLAAPYYISRV